MELVAASPRTYAVAHWNRCCPRSGAYRAIPLSARHHRPHAVAHARPPVRRRFYLTFDDGPNPAATPQLLDVLRKHDVSATFFVLDRHLTRETLPILRTFEEGHAVALHSHTRRLMLAGRAVVATTLQEAAARIEVWNRLSNVPRVQTTGRFPQRTHADGCCARRLTVAGWGWMLWDFQLVSQEDG